MGHYIQPYFLIGDFHPFAVAYVIFGAVGPEFNHYPVQTGPCSGFCPDLGLIGMGGVYGFGHLLEGGAFRHTSEEYGNPFDVIEETQPVQMYDEKIRPVAVMVHQIFHFIGCHSLSIKNPLP